MQEQVEGREVELEINLPTEGPIHLTAQTLYSRPGFGFAARFTEVAPQARDKLTREFHRLRKRVGEAR